jgi:hypothetical protein
MVNAISCCRAKPIPGHGRLDNELSCSLVIFADSVAVVRVQDPLALAK